jgi:hypothetical protein
MTGRIVAVKVAHDETTANNLLSEGWDLLTTFYVGHLPGYNPSVVFVLVMKQRSDEVVRLDEQERAPLRAAIVHEALDTGPSGPETH